MRGTRTLALVGLAGAATAGFAAASFARKYRPFPVRVSGASMEPTLQRGDLLAVSPVVTARIGDVIVVESGEIEIVKRVAEIHGTTWHLTGDNRRSSTDHYVDADDVKGVVIARYWPNPRRF